MLAENINSSSAVATAYSDTPQADYDRPEHRKRRRRALVVDDNPDIADMLTIILQHEGYEVVAVYSASDALGAAFTRHFDVIISDIGMPGMNGYELAQALRAMPEYSTVPMVAVTGFAMYDDRDRTLDAGFSAHLSKPIDPVSLTQLISHLGH